MDFMNKIFWFLLTPLFFSFGGGGGGGEEEDDEGEEDEDETQEDDEAEAEDEDDEDKKKAKVKKAKTNADNAKARVQGGDDRSKKILKAAGFETEDELIASATKQKKADDEAKSELEKATAKIDTETKRADEAEAKTKDIQSTSNLRLMRAEVLVEAVKEDHNINQTALNDIWGFIVQDKKVLKLIEIDDEGEITGVDDAVEKVLEGRDYLLNGDAEPKKIGNKTKVKPKPKSKKKGDDEVPEFVAGKKKISL